VLSCDIVLETGAFAEHICTEYLLGGEAVRQNLSDVCNSSAGTGRGAQPEACAEGEIASCSVREPFGADGGVEQAILHWYPGRDTQGRPSQQDADGLRESCMGSFAEGSGPLADPPTASASGGAMPTTPGSTALRSAGYWGSCRQDYSFFQSCTEHETTGATPAQFVDQLSSLCAGAALSPERCPRAGTEGGCELRTPINGSADSIQRVFFYGLGLGTAQSSCTGKFVPSSG
jgi:hypothetical protein